MAKWPLRKQIVWGLAVGLAISCAVVPATVAFLVWRAEQCADWTTREFLRPASLAEAAPCIRAAAAVDIVDGWGLTPLVWAVGDTPDPQVVRALLDAGADPTFTDRWGQTPLHRGAENPRAEVVAMLLDAGRTPMRERSTARPHCTTLHIPTTPR